MNTFLNIAITVGIVLAPVLMAGLAFLVKKIHDYIDQKVKNEKLASILKRLTDGAQKVVLEVEQTFVSNLDPYSPKDSAQKAKDLALTSLKSWVGPKGIEELKQVLGLNDEGVTSLLSSNIESEVLKRKVNLRLLSDTDPETYNENRILSKIKERVE